MARRDPSTGPGAPGVSRPSRRLGPRSVSAAPGRVLGELARRARVSRRRLSAGTGLAPGQIEDALRVLRRQGLEVRATRRLVSLAGAPFEPYVARRVLRHLSPEARAALRGLEVLGCVDSTNEHLRRRARLGEAHGLACLAEWQSAGRGRRGRSWVAPVGGALCLSLAWRFSLPPRAVVGLSLAVGAALARLLDAEGVADLGLKWPNDLVRADRKLGGILIELTESGPQSALVVIGVGLNLDLPRAAAGRIAQPVTDLRAALGRTPPRNRLAARVLGALLDSLASYERDGLAASLPGWRRFDATFGRRVSVLTQGRRVEGLARGIDAAGALCVEVGDRVERFHGGEVSVRVGL